MNFAYRAITVCVLVPFMTGCTSSIHASKDFDRVAYSQVSSPLSGDDFLWFDVKLTPQYPDNNDAAEAKRMEWLVGWLERKALCPAGYEITDRRPFEFLEHNPARYDLRYKIECTVPPPAES